MCLDYTDMRYELNPLCRAALLANCGLFVPCTQAKISTIDSFFLRTASFDVPSENKSAFGLEMGTIQINILG